MEGNNYDKLLKTLSELEAREEDLVQRGSERTAKENSELEAIRKKVAILIEENKVEVKMEDTVGDDDNAGPFSRAAVLMRVGEEVKPRINPAEEDTLDALPREEIITKSESIQDTLTHSEKTKKAEKDPERRRTTLNWSDLQKKMENNNS